MDIRTSVRNRREARIRELLEEKANPASATRQESEALLQAAEFNKKHFTGSLASPLQDSVSERDPEKLWKQGYRGWEEPVPTPPASGPPRLMTGLLRRIVISALLFGAVWGVFSTDQPWAARVQWFVLDGLSREMDFAAAQAWYEEHFGGAPSFIPIFGQDPQESTKVNGEMLVPPLSGTVLQPFVVDMKGIKIVPQSEQQSSREVHSIEAGRVMKVRPLPDGLYTLEVQHRNGRYAQYSGLSHVTLRAEDWVQGGDVLGVVPLSVSSGEEPVLYFMLKEGSMPVDPADVIPF
ncbi:M23 family metallopeptidase [Paenibacillus sp. F411]|uniref:M23 family metallopeptidase n=1 Tax=Paenibacillus sp. F411 TaxID=2820239 RepID=UPI001AAF6C15|nr:M23 family metallopeptidase [Paenibacillus sp. F411]MBO2943934.1 M23 family metallopeptidase [Paenibacillus sp. F411]